MFKSTERAALQEIGPRFTLKLKYIKKGIPAVHQLGAAPPPLQFDNDEGDEEEKHIDAAAKPTSTTALPAKDEEYIWQWKVGLSVDIVFEFRQKLIHILAIVRARDFKKDLFLVILYTLFTVLAPSFAVFYLL